MALGDFTTTREFAKFKLNSLGETAVNVIAESSAPVVVLPIGFSRLYSFGQISSIAASMPTIIVSYTVPPGYAVYLTKVLLSGTNKAIFTVQVDGSPIADLITYYTDLNGSLGFGDYGIELTAGQILTVVAEHERPSMGDFSASLIGIKREL